MLNVKKLAQSPPTLSHCVGSLVEITATGQAMVDFPGNIYGPQPVRSALTSEDTSLIQKLPMSVLLIFENDDPQLPIISGVIKETIFQYPTQQRAQPQTEAKSANTKSDQVLIDGNKLTIDAQEELILQCGDSSISLKQHGKVVIRGTQLISHASGANKIKGGNVNIN